MPDALPPSATLAGVDLVSAQAAFENGIAARRSANRSDAAAWFLRALTADPAHRAARIEHATVLRELGRLEEAEAEYRTLLQQQPGWFFPLLGLGLCARQRGDLPGALLHLAAAAPNDRGARHEYATTLRELGRLNEAEAEYQQVLAVHPGWFPALLGLGLCARRRRDLPAAQARLAAALAAAPNDRGARHEYATTLRELGRVEEAEVEYRQVLAVHPGWPAALLGLGLCARQRRDLPAAVEHLAAAVAAAPNDRAARHEYATTLRELGRLGEAEAAYQQTLAADPGWFPAFMGLGLCARQRRDLPAAAEHLAAAVAAAPNDRGARHEYATTLRELGRLEEAEAAYRQLLAAHPDWSPALLGQGLCARQRGDRAEAMARFQAAAAAMPDNSAAWLEVLTEHTDAGRLDEARAIAARMLERDRACPQGWLGLGRIERQAGNRAAALEAFEQGHARCPGQQNFLIEMGIETQALGRFAEAETWLQQAASIERLAPLALTLLGEQARMAQRFEDAVTLFRRSVERRDAPVSSHTALAQTLADLGRPEEALATLDAAERHFGARPELAMRRASLLRRTGLRDEALALVRSANAAAPSHFPLWYERFENERFATVPEGDTPIDLDALLQAAPAASVRERALVHHARGLLAEQCWQLEAAADEHRQAIALDGAHGGMHEALARVSLLLCDTETARQQLLATMRLATPMRQLQGLSLHLAHTHLGQILDEYLMDPAALAALADAQAQPPAERIAALLTLARDRPDSTPAAIALLIALRQAGWLAGPPADAPSGRVPPAIAQYWNEQAPPDDVSRLMQTWPEQNPGHRYVRFDAAAAQAFLAQHCMPDVLLAYRRSREPAKQADLFRLAWLFCEGGVYADADDRCLRPLEAWLPAGADLVLYQEEYGTLGNNFIAATPFHPVLGLALRMAVTAINRGDDDLLWLSTGPGLISRALVQTLATSCLTPPAWLRRMAILQRHELAQGVAAHCMAGYQNTKQYWQRAAFRGPKGRQPAPQ